MQNPKTKYPQPPFEKQSQEFPGLASNVDPKEDYGRGTYKGNGKLKGKVALITGGDSGIGRATAYTFICEGAQVAISFLPEEESDAKELEKAVKELGKEILLLPGDIQEEEQCKLLVQRTIEAYGHLDILVNNAAYQKSIPKVTDVTKELLDQTFKTNVYAPYFLIKAAWDSLKPGSCIINTSSVQAYKPSPEIMVYASTKAALVNMTKSFAQRGAEKGIRVNSVAPGPIWTPLNTIDPPPGHVEHFGEQSWLKRPGQPIEVAHVFVFLASEESSYVTGHVYGVTGGAEMGI
jgi:NAD(P)-dependent dehydrogenase (short-subunit alcohol dehydrogenase family)